MFAEGRRGCAGLLSGYPGGSQVGASPRVIFLSPSPAVIDIKLDKPQEPPASEGGCSC